MTVELLAFTDRGEALARRLAEALPGEAARCGAPLPLAAWTARAFGRAGGLVFVGAAGIAVRAIAPHLKSKTTDPAVVVVDEAGRFAVPVLSGHLGGANELARRIAALTGGTPVLTTSTDVNGVFAVDLWAKCQRCAVLDPGRIKTVSAKLLGGGSVTVQSDWPVAGEPPPGVSLTADGPADVTLTLRPAGRAGLRLVPRLAALGVGCRRGTSRQALDAALDALLAQSGVSGEALCQVCTIDLKENEPGLLEFCAARGLPLRTFTAAQLAALPGNFTPSAFVQRVTGVDNVCERAAVLGSGGELALPKAAGSGVTMALALAPFAPDWRWNDA